MMISEEELKDRLSKWKPLKPRVRRGVLAIWSQLAEQADMGAVLCTKI